MLDLDADQEEVDLAYDDVLEVVSVSCIVSREEGSRGQQRGCGISQSLSHG